MPTYDYACTACGHQFSAKQKMSDARLVDCPECAKPNLERVIGAAGFALKGSGLYQTDFKGGSKPAESPAPACGMGGCGAGGCAGGEAA